jgi:hypothetical protein
MKPFKENRLGVVDTFKTSLYAEPALAPSMQWLDAVAPGVPIGVKVKDGKLTWRAVTNEDIRSWTLYQQKGTTWKLAKVLPAATTTATLEPGTYALCTVDRSANESLGVVVSL